MVGLLFVVPIVFRRGFKYEWQAALGFTLKIKHLGRVGLIFLIAYVGLAQLVYVINLCMLAQLFQDRLPCESPAHTEMSVISMPSRTESIWEFQLHTISYTYVCMYVRTYICMYVYIYVHVWVSSALCTHTRRVIHCLMGTIYVVLKPDGLS